MDLIQILDENGVHYRRSNAEWVNMRCCFCPDHSEHLGINVVTGQVNCWRCGGHGLIRTVSKITNKSEEYTSSLIGHLVRRRKPSPTAVLPKMPIRSAALPPRVYPLLSIYGACKYLEDRRFDPKMLQDEWNVLATGPGAIIKVNNKTIDYSYRVIAPVYYEGKMVSFQGRDWTGKNKPKYLACPREWEGVCHKDIVYGLDKATASRAIAVEGVFDTWRIGAGCIALFGIKFRMRQVALIAKTFDEVMLLFDREPRARLQAERMMRELREYGIVVSQGTLPQGKDPADLTTEEAAKFAI